jgi:signal transduction histidine kinase
VRRALALLLLLLAAGVSGVVAGVFDGWSHALPTVAIFCACGAPAVLFAHVLASNRRRLGSLSGQFAAGVVLAVALVLAGVGAAVLLMFVELSHVYVIAALVVFAAGTAAYSTSLVAGAVKEDVEAIRDTLRAVGDGDGGAVAIRTGARDELAELADAANRMIAQLREREAERDAADKARRDLIAAVSHDLRTPLTSLRLVTQAVDDGVISPDGEARRYMEEMSKQVDALGLLVDDLFELTRLEAGDISWSMHQVELADLVHETLQAMRPQAAARGVAVEAAVPDDLAPAEANPEKVQRVLFNLIQNAIRHTPADGSVTVAAESNGSHLVIEVRDTGEGIEPEERGRVFEPFYRGAGESARTRRESSGLGLAICRAIVEAHGGEIWLEDVEPGTRVRFSLPRAGVAAPADPYG